MINKAIFVVLLALAVVICIDPPVLPESFQIAYD